MKNTYRVDRVDSLRVPCGMTSILYYGTSKSLAQKAFSKAQTGLDTWGKKNDEYGVVLSQWNKEDNDYNILLSKGLGYLQ